MITKKIGVDFKSGEGTLILKPSEVTELEKYEDAKEYSRTHEDGWTITGFIWSDYFYWVNEFSASHPIFGKVWGDFENEVFADSEEGYNDFLNNHAPEEWDFGDI